MKVFISWSGEPSKTVALALRDWLPSVLQKVKPWMSQSDLDAGVRWGAVLAEELNDTDFGIICLTRNNQRAPWLLFEAGALGKKLEEGTYVIPFLIQISSAEIESGPLIQFQAKQSDQDGTWALVRTINKASKDPLEEQVLKKSFDRGWPELKQVLDSLPDAPTSPAPRRSADDMLEEVLDLVRELARRTSSPTSAQLAWLLSSPDSFRIVNLAMLNALEAGILTVTQNALEARVFTDATLEAVRGIEAKLDAEGQMVQSLTEPEPNTLLDRENEYRQSGNTPDNTKG